MPKNIAEPIGAQFRDARALSFQIRAAAPPMVNGDSATVNCNRLLSMTAKDGQRLPAVNDHVRVTLERAGSTWVIRAIAPY
jgi:hypothetical protein